LHKLDDFASEAKHDSVRAACYVHQLLEIRAGQAIG
jgi:hypothetical protein